MQGEVTKERCPRCGSLLLSDGERFWCSFVGGEKEKACAFGINKPINGLALGIIKARGHEGSGMTPPRVPITFSAPQRPYGILAWAVATFGSYANKPDERARRLLEEAVELAQALGLKREDVGKIVDRAYERPAGDPAKEIAQVGMTLEALAAVLDVDLSAAIDGEFARVRAKSGEHWKGRAAEKHVAGTEDVA